MYQQNQVGHVTSAVTLFPPCPRNPDAVRVTPPPCGRIAPAPAVRPRPAPLPTRPPTAPPLPTRPPSANSATGAPISAKQTGQLPCKPFVGTTKSSLSTLSTSAVRRTRPLAGGGSARPLSLACFGCHGQSAIMTGQLLAGCVRSSASLGGPLHRFRRSGTGAQLGPLSCRTCFCRGRAARRTVMVSRFLSVLASPLHSLIPPSLGTFRPSLTVSVCLRVRRPFTTRASLRRCRCTSRS